jgi:biopolymer transport protein TolQ
MIQFGTFLSGGLPGGAVPAAHTLYVPEGCLRTPGGPLLALLLQAEGGATPRSSGPQVLELIAQTSRVSQFVLLVLALLSVVSWSIILYKWWTFRRSSRQTSSFLDIFRRSNKFSEVQAVCRSLADTPLVGLFQAGYAELTAQLRQPGDVGNGPAPTNPQMVVARPTLKSVASVDRALLRAAAIELNKLERHLPFLATTASIAPFVGLFGTVWGILSAFEGISQTGSTSLGVVARPIAEALIATAFGLAAAIPAVMAYNHFTHRVKLFASEMDDFAMEFLNIAERNFT